MFCAYCGEGHDESTAFTDEHVVPYAIGGSNAFTIRVCQASNNSLGGLVDKPFIENFIVRSQRFLLGLSGTDGTEPTLDLSGEKEISGKNVDVTYRVQKDNTKLLKIASPTVTKTSVKEGERWTVSGDPADVRRVIEGKLNTVMAKGKTITDANGKVLTPDDLDALLAGNVKPLDPGILMTVQLDLLDFVRFFAKLTLATGHYVWGDTFSRSPYARVLRTAMHAKTDASIPGAHIWPHIEGAENVLAYFRKKDSHRIGVLTNPRVFAANLFGTIGAVVPLDQPENVKLSSEPCSGRVFEIALPSRKFLDRTFEQYLLVLQEELQRAAEPR